MRRILHVAASLLLAGLARAESGPLDTLLENLDARAAELQAQLVKDGHAGARVAGLVSRRWAGGKEQDRNRPYVVATYSFEHATRDDQTLVRNDWDVLFGNGEDVFDVRTVTDDTSLIWDLGDVDFDGFSVKNLARDRREGKERVDVASGHVYVIHTVDTETNQWAKLKVLEFTKGTSVIFRWEVIGEPGEVLELERRPGNGLQRGRIRIQLRSGAIGGNPVRGHMNGKVSGHVAAAGATPVDMTGKVESKEPQQAFIEGATIPRGKVWILRRIEYSGYCGKDSNGDGPFVVSVGGKELARVEPDTGGFRSEWKGRLVVRPGSEDSVRVEISNSSRCEVIFYGAICDEKWANVEKIPALTAEERKAADALVRRLDDDDPDVREKATRELSEMGPPVVEYLKGLDLAAQSAEVRSRVREVLGVFGEE